MSDEALLAPALPEQAHETPPGDCRIAYRAAGYIWQILAPPFDPGVAVRVSALSEAGDLELRSAGPGIWYLIGDEPLTARDIADREARLGPQARIVDQTHGRVRIELSGPGALRLLARGTAVDLSPSRFPIGCACETLHGRIGIHLTRTGAETFELLVGRSYAISLWEELTD